MLLLLVRACVLCVQGSMQLHVRAAATRFAACATCAEAALRPKCLHKNASHVACSCCAHARRWWSR